MTFSWTPYDARYHIGGYLRDNPYLGWFLQMSAEADVRQVKNPGLTGLADTSYSWIGGIARLSLFFLPFADVDPIIRKSIFLCRDSMVFIDVSPVWHGHPQIFSAAEIQDRAGGILVNRFRNSRGTDKDTLVFAADIYG